MPPINNLSTCTITNCVSRFRFPGKEGWGPVNRHMPAWRGPGRRGESTRAEERRQSGARGDFGPVRPEEFREGLGAARDGRRNRGSGPLERAGGRNFSGHFGSLEREEQSPRSVRPLKARAI